ncbi:hypothetical protein O3M35_007562 [Rhynocoris fuscipes]|uniref:Uncharacterized protein n=1 Tax=Rhynocoris fuscipes TaxID=488301 RepID=A0AAW1DCF1_9HEMI
MPVPLEFALHDPEITLSKAAKAKKIDDERKQRFFDSKQRQIGVDIDALNLQVEEKHQRILSEKELDKKFEIYNNVLAREEKEMKLKELKERKHALEQLKNYWKIYQRREFSRDFDLNDPDYLKKSLPMCTDDNDPRIKSKGSLLRFDGEDYDGMKGKKKSTKLKQILDDQIREEEARRVWSKIADEEWAKEAAVQSEFNIVFSKLEERIRKEEIKQIQAYNLLLAKEKQNEKDWEKKRNYSDDLSHVYNCLTSSFFLETGKDGILTPEQLREMKEIQKLQIIEQEEKRAQENAINKYLINLSADRARDEQKIAENNAFRRKAEALRIRDINLQLAIEQRQRRKDLDREAHGLTEQQIMIREQANNNVSKCNDVLNAMYGSALIVSLIKSMFFNSSDDKWAPMYPGWWPVEINSTNRYVGLCIYHICIAISTVSMGSSFFKTYVAIGCQILGQLDILAVTIIDTFNKENATDDYLRNRIKAIVEHHNAIYDIFKQYHKLFHFSFLWGAMSQELLLCTLAYLVTDPESNWASISSFTLIMAGELTITLLGCQLGEYIIQKGNNINETLYNINWYERTPKIQKDLLIIMLRCKKPLQVKAGGIMVYCREGFKDVSIKRVV